MSGKNLVLGATGGIGRAVVVSLLKRNERIIVLVRNREKAAAYFKEFKEVEIIEGDAGNTEDVTLAAEGCKTLFYCINTPYPKWETTVRELLAVSIDASVKAGAKLVFPGNVYVYGHAQYNKVDELHPKFAHTKKGKLRIEMEKMLLSASKSKGLKFAIIRMPDFYGPYVVNGFSEKVFINSLKGKPLQWIGKKDIPLELIFIEDAGEAMAAAGLSDKSACKEFNLPGYSKTTTRQFLEEISRQGGKGSKLQVLNSDIIFSLMGLFNPVIKEVKEMLYLKREELILDGTLFKKTFGVLYASPYEEGIAKTLTWAKDFF